MADEKKVVWILGAGFSKSLGGPLLKDLLSPRAYALLRAQYHDVLSAGGRENPKSEQIDEGPTLHAEARTVFELFAYGTGNFLEWKEAIRDPGGSRLPGFHEWDDAEHFLDFLDSARTNDQARARLNRLLEGARRQPVGEQNVNAQRLHHVAQRVIAAQCSAFLSNNPTTLERWQPYTRWASSLRRSDTLITFNYDCVVETAALHLEPGETQVRGVHVLTFERDTRIDVELDKARAADQPVLVKLHGSVDWEHVATAGRAIPYKRSKTPDYAVLAGPNERISISTPGQSKKERADKELKPLWDYACERIKDAGAIVFLGYRFPPSDAQARERLLDAISGNARAAAPQGLNAHVVLGDDERATRRLTALLQRAGQRAGRVVHPQKTDLFVEDFLTVYSRDNL